MNIVFNKCLFAYLCLFYSSTKYFHEFQSIFVNFCFTNIFDISVKSKYRYIRNYQYFVPCSNCLCDYCRLLSLINIYTIVMSHFLLICLISCIHSAKVYKLRLHMFILLSNTINS